MPSSPGGPSGGGHHHLPPHEVVLLLQTDPDRGLTSAEAARRLARYGPNQLPAAARASWLTRLAHQFANPLVGILIAAGVITAVLGEYVDSAVIAGVVLINAVVGYVQEARADAALDALRSLVRTTARVVRDGRELTIPSADIVVGDLVLVEAGDKVPADLRLIRETELQVDESALTGESTPVVKDEVVLPPETPVADRRNMVYNATLVTSGAGAGVVVATGAESEVGRIHRLVSAAETLATPLTRKLARFSKVLTVVILALAAVTFGVGLARGESVAAMVTAAIALAVGAIPEGLPAAVTITLAIGVGRMAKRHAVVRRLPAVETLGSTTVICTDKTGTLTRNEMTVQAVWTPDTRFEVTGTGYAPNGVIRPVDGGEPVARADAGAALTPALRWCLIAGAGCNEADLIHDEGPREGEDPRKGDDPREPARWRIVGDPTEAALLVAAAKAGITADTLAAHYPRVATIPFSSERRYMATLHRDSQTERLIVLAKGSLERILDLCDAELGADGTPRRLDRAAAQRAADGYAAAGLRVLATAVGLDVSRDDFAEDRLPARLAFTGLFAMLDPPREDAIAAVRACREAGITVMMITGDHATTATAIAERMGLLDGPDRGQVLTGDDLARLVTADGMPTTDDRMATVDRARVFARVSPEQKLRLVEALQDRGQVVAMTGDGVNDAPALRQADIGVAMGRSGTEVAKDAADIVLTDDNFATIEAAVEEGRSIVDNLTKFIVWTLPTNMGEGLVILSAIVLGATLPVLPTQILWINMTTAVLLGLMLAFEPSEPGVMTRPPRDPRQPLFGAALVTRVLLVSALVVAGAWWLFESESARGASVEEARTAAVNAIVAIQAFYLFSCRSLRRSVLHVGLFANRWIVVGVAVQVVAQLVLTYVPAMHTLFHTAPIGLDVWARILGVAAGAAIVVGVEKRVRRWADQRRAAAPATGRHAVAGTTMTGR
jgi:cation-transporting ATPase F